MHKTVMLTSLLFSVAIKKYIYTNEKEKQTLFLVFIKGHNKKVRAVITAQIIIFHFFSGQMDYWVIIPLSCLEPTLIVQDFQCVFHWLNSAPAVRNQTKPVPEIPLHKLALASQYGKNQYTKTNQHKNPPLYLHPPSFFASGLPQTSQIFLMHDSPLAAEQQNLLQRTALLEPMSVKTSCCCNHHLFTGSPQCHELWRPSACQRLLRLKAWTIYWGLVVLPSTPHRSPTDHLASVIYHHLP